MNNLHKLSFSFSLVFILIIIFITIPGNKTLSKESLYAAIDNN